MASAITIFVSYSHQDAKYLGKDSLLGFLQGLEKDGVVFWTDRQIKTGERWDDVIKANIQKADIALVLISQGLLDSDYCQNVEIRHFLAQKTHLFPIILSPCEWRRHEWLASRQFLPGGDKTIEEHYKDSGSRKRLFLEIRAQLRERIERIRQGSSTVSAVPPTAGSIAFSGKAKIAFCDHLGSDWKRLADQLEIKPADQAQFERGDEGRAIWVWLENRRRLNELPDALSAIGRADLIELWR
jgi:hypothetical protein